MNTDIEHPINAFTKDMQDIINHYAEVKGYPHEYFLTAVLAAASTGLGRAVTLSTGNFTAIGIIWAAIVGKPGLTKSEAQSDAFAPIKNAQFEILKSYQSQAEELEEIKRNNPKDKTELQDPERFLLSDITPESLSITLANNPKGCGIVYDELAGFIGRFNRYNSGADEQMFLSLFNGDTIMRTRVNGAGNAAIKDSFLTIIGTIQPRVMKTVFDGKTDSGFFDRWLIANPENVRKQYPSAYCLNPVIEGKYDTVISRLMDLKYNEHLAEQMAYSPTSFAIVNEYQRWLIDQQNETEKDEERSILAKMEIYIHRFALLLQSLQYADCSNQYIDATQLLTVNDSAAKGAVVLTKYFLNQAQKMRLINPVEFLKNEWIDIYNSLPEHGFNFTRTQFIKACENAGIKTRQADNFLKANAERSELKVFFKVSHGVYTKNLF